jgi:hypothetical protein
MTTVSTDQSQNLKMVFRKGEGRPITFQFLEGTDNYDISSLGFAFQILEIDGTTPLVELTEASGDGVTNSGVTGALLVDLTDDEVDIDEKSYEWKLKIISPYTRTLFNGLFKINNSPQESVSSDSVTVNIDLGDIVVEIDVTLAMTGDQIISTLSQENIESLYQSLLPYITGEQTP